MGAQTYDGNEPERSSPLTQLSQRVAYSQLLCIDESSPMKESLRGADRALDHELPHRGRLHAPAKPHAHSPARPFECSLTGGAAAGARRAETLRSRRVGAEPNGCNAILDYLYL